ncbi:MAG: hypothetical protein ACTSWX_05005 [Promethearchaeota archaeon]
MIDFNKLDEKLKSGDLKQTLLEIDKFLIKYKEDSLLSTKLEFYKGKNLKFLEKFDEGLEIFNKINQESLKTNNLNVFIESSLNIAEIYSRKGNLTKSFEFIEMIENKLKSAENLDVKEILRYKIELYNIKSYYHWRNGELAKALENIKESLKIGEKFGDKHLLGQIYYLHGTIVSESGDLIKGLEILDNSLEILKKFKDKYLISKILNNIGWTYKLQGKLDLAIKNIKLSIDLTKECKMKRGIRIELGNLGVLNWQKGKLNRALHYLNQSLEMDKKIGNKMEIADTLFYIFTISLDKKNLSESQKYLDELKDLDISSGENKRIHALYEVAKALLFKIKPRVKEIYEAEEILKRIIDSDVIKFELTVIAMINLCYLYILELKQNNDENILSSIKETLQKLLIIAENHHSYQLWIEVYLIQAKFALIQPDFQKARELLTKAQNLADSKGLNRLAKAISEEHDQMLKKTQIWTTLVNSKLPISEKLNIAKINPQMERLLRQGDIEDVQIKNEIPIALSIIKEDGPVLFSKVFDPGWVADEHLIGALISAFSLFSKQLFSENFDRAKFGEYFIIVRSISPILISYIYKGSSYSALRKLKDLSKILNKKEVWVEINKYIKKNEIFSHQMIPYFNENIKKIFLH